MTNTKDQLKKLDDNKLIDVVKNYRQYGYDDELRELAISILNQRGISRQELELMGSFENKSYAQAQELFSAFKRHSKIAFAFYILVFLMNVLLPMMRSNTETLNLILLLINYGALIGYLIFLFKSFTNQNQFYRVSGEGYGTQGVLMYLLLGMPFYIFMYFYFRDQMKEKMQHIR